MPRYGVCNDGFRGRRATPRGNVRLPALVETIGTYGHVEVINVSKSGARLRGSNLPETNKLVLVRVGPLDVLGTVVWDADGQCGVQFDDPLNNAEFARVRRDGSVVAGKLTLDERQAAEDWRSGLAR